MRVASLYLCPSIFLVGLAGALLVLAGCASSGEKVQRERGSPHMITSEQISQYLADHPTGTAFDIIRQHRPSWIGGRVANRTVWVYEGYWRHGSASDYLPTVALERVQRLEFLGGGPATSRFGRGHEAGVIVVSFWQ